MQQAVKQIDDKIEVVAFEYKEPVKAVTGDDAVDWSHLPANDVIPSYLLVLEVDGLCSHVSCSHPYLTIFDC